MGKFLLFLLLLYCAAFETPQGASLNIPFGFDLGFFVKNTNVRPTPPLNTKKPKSEFEKLKLQAIRLLSIKIEDLGEKELSKIRRLKKQVEELQKTAESDYKMRRNHALLIQLENLLKQHSKLESEDMKYFRNLTEELENAMNDKEVTSKVPQYLNVMKEIRDFSPKVPLTMVNYASLVIIKFAKVVDDLQTSKNASKIIWSIEEKLLKNLHSSQISDLINEIIQSEKFFGPKNNRAELQRIKVIKGRFAEILSEAYILERAASIISSKNLENVKLDSKVMMVKNLKHISEKSHNQYYKATARDLYKKLKNLLEGKNSQSSSSEDLQKLKALSIKFELLKKEANLKELKSIKHQLEELVPKLPDHNSEINAILKEFYKYEEIFLQHKEAIEILQDITRSLKHANLTEALLHKHTEQFSKAVKYLKRYHEASNLNDTSHLKNIQHHKIELSNALTSLNVVNLAHKIVNMNEEEYEKVHQDPHVKDLLKSLEIIVQENENDNLRKSAEQLKIALGKKIKADEQMHKNELNELDAIKDKLSNVAGFEELNSLSKSIDDIEKKSQLMEVKKKAEVLRKVVFEIKKIYSQQLESLKIIEQNFPNNPVGDLTEETSLKFKKMPQNLMEIINSKYQDPIINAKAKKLLELIMKLLGSNNDKKAADDDENNPMDDAEIKEVEIKKSAQVLKVIVEQLISQMPPINSTLNQIDDEIKILEKYNTNSIDMTPFISRKKVIQEEFNRVVKELEATKEKLNKLAPISVSAKETFEKENASISEVIDKMVQLDNLLTENSTISLYKDTFKDTQEVEHILSAIEQLNKMMQRLKKYVKIPTTENPIESTSKIIETTVEISQSSTEIESTTKTIEETTLITEVASTSEKEVQ